MRVLKKNSFIVCVLGLAGCLAGCVPAKPGFRGFFTPPGPKAQVADDLEPPSLGSAPEINDSPRLFIPPVQSDIRPGGRADLLLREAESHFQAGRRYYQYGDEDNARREFDRAVEILLSAPEGAASRLAIEKRLNEYVEAIHRYDLAGLGAGDLSEPGFEKPPLEDLPQLTFPIDPKLKNKVLEEVRATASQLPLEATDAVLSYIRYFSSERGRRMLLFGLRRQGRYRPMIQRILAEEGVPQELIFLAQAESGFLPRAVSRMRATGMWQFVLGRGREYGLKQTPWTDDRFDPERATRAAARHLRDLYQRYGDWYLAMAAYNCGPGNVDKAVERTGYADFWELRRRGMLPKETTNYVPIVLAMTIMVKNPREYGLESYETDPPLEYDTVEVSAATNLLLISDLAEAPVSQLRELNPALLKSVAPSGYAVRVPKGSAQQLRAGLEAVPGERRAAWRAHRVSEGDTLASIARRFRLGESAIAAVNQVDGTLETGELLVIPAFAEPERTVTKAAKNRTRLASSRTRRGKTSSARAAGSRQAVAKATRRGAKTASAAPPRRRTARFSGARVAASRRAAAPRP